MIVRANEADPLRVVSWNVGGIRAAQRKGLRAKVRRLDPDIFAIQEVRARVEQLPRPLHSPKGYRAHYVVAERPGYSGVGLWSRDEPDEVATGLGAARFDAEGRFQVVRWGRLAVANVYFPNGNGRDRNNDRVPYKLAFYRAVFDALQRRRRSGQRVLVMGDFNTARAAIDLARPNGNKHTSGWLPEEVAELGRWIDRGWVDTFRAFHSGPGHYTWWSQRQGVRARNIGWRIDYVLASPAAMPFVTDAFIRPRIMGSDHCPLGVELASGVRLR
ncbi:MAG: exodeoxyribonuclease III [Myxococcota bacterium]